MGNIPKWEPEVKLVSITSNPEEVIEQAYRNCWQSQPKTPEVEARRAFLEKCIRRGHLSPLEFAVAAFEIVGSRVYTHQQVRHRIASYAQESQRYVKVNDPNYFVIPPTIHDNPQALDIFLKAINNAWNAYQNLLNLGIKKEDARYLLPNACKSKILVEMNFRSWRHFLKLRCDKSAQWEIRGVAQEILKILYENAPGVFGDLYQKFILNEGKGELWTERD
jgi:thymidylate synthase (FAD)